VHVTVGYKDIIIIYKTLLLLLLIVVYIHVLFTVCIGNGMVSSALWIKHARMSFQKTIKIARVRRTNAI
jgi:hypothetical protein